MTEHEKRNVYRVRYAHLGGKDYLAVKDMLERFVASGATKLEVEFVDYKEIERVKAEAHAAGRREVLEEIRSEPTSTDSERSFTVFALQEAHEQGRREGFEAGQNDVKDAMTGWDKSWLRSMRDKNEAYERGRRDAIAEVMPTYTCMLEGLEEACCCTPDMKDPPSFKCVYCDWSKGARALRDKLKDANETR